MLPLFAAIALAAAPASHAWMFGMRLGVGWPYGEIGQGLPVRADLWGAVPFQLELGWRLPSRHFTLAGFGAYGAPVNQPVLEEHVWGQLVRFGVEAFYEPFPRAQLSPWVGLALAGEWLQFRRGEMNQEATLKAAIDGLGFAPLDLQLGFNWWLQKEAVGVGPYLEFSAGRFVDVQVTQYGFTRGYPPAWHQLLTLGLEVRL